MEEDVKNEELETSSEESTEENQEEESKGTDKSKDVPYSRFSEVVKERNEARKAAEEAEAKFLAAKDALDPKPEPQQEKKSEDSLTREDAILYAKGKTDEQVEFATKVAELEGISKLEALENPLYTAWEEKQSEAENNKKAQMGASKGSAAHVVETFTPGLSKDEHKALWEKASENL